MSRLIKLPSSLHDGLVSIERTEVPPIPDTANPMPRINHDISVMTGDRLLKRLNRENG